MTDFEGKEIDYTRKYTLRIDCDECENHYTDGKDVVYTHTYFKQREKSGEYAEYGDVVTPEIPKWRCPNHPNGIRHLLWFEETVLENEDFV